MVCHPDDLLKLGDSEVEVTRPFRRLFMSSSTQIRIEPEEVQTSPHTGVYIGARFRTDLGRLYLWRPGSRHYSLSQIILHSTCRSIQTSTIPESAGTDDSHTAVSGTCPPPHAIHPVIPEAAMHSHNPRVVTPDPCQRSGPLTALVVRQAPPVPGNAFYIPQCHHHYHYG